MAKCGKCGCWLPVCKCGGGNGPAAHTWKPMWFTDICEKPLFIESKKQLKRECKENKVKAECLM